MEAAEAAVLQGYRAIERAPGLMAGKPRLSAFLSGVYWLSNPGPVK